MADRRPFVQILCAFIALCSIEGHSLDNRIHSFVVTGESRDTLSVRLPQRKASCSFDYMAGQPQHENKPSEDKAEVRAEDVLEKLTGQCTQGQSGYWTYQICLGGIIRQFHGADSYMLGTYSRVEGRILKYNKGLPCDPPKNMAERQVDVSLACSDKLGVQLISEPSTCKYTMTLVTPLVCSDPSYPKLMQSAGSTVPADDGHEEWLLEIRETEDGKIACIAHSTEERLSGSQLAFKSFSLKIDHDESSANIEIDSAKARRMGRVPLGSTEIKVNQDSISHGEDFNGKLSYAEVVTKPI